jgi:hypothetical protein
MYGLRQWLSKGRTFSTVLHRNFSKHEKSVEELLAKYPRQPGTKSSQRLRLGKYDFCVLARIMTKFVGSSYDSLLEMLLIVVEQPKNHTAYV